jgi:hypothetical protein
LRSPGGISSNQCSFDEPVGDAFHEMPVFEEARLAFLSVDHQETTGGVDGTGCLPLAGRRKIGAATAQQSRLQDLSNDLIR